MPTFVGFPFQIREDGGGDDVDAVPVASDGNNTSPSTAENMIANANANLDANASTIANAEISEYSHAEVPQTVCEGGWR